MEYSFGTFDDPFMNELVDWIDGRSILEVFAGNGLLASKLESRGVDVVATSLFRGHDGHGAGMYFDVVEMRASTAARQYVDRDILLMSWPTADEGALQAALAWGEERPIVFIGEVTRLDEGLLGGCASDMFFDLTEETTAFSSYNARNILERAAVRELRRGATLEFQRHVDERMDGVSAKLGVV